MTVCVEEIGTSKRAKIGRMTEFLENEEKLGNHTLTKNNVLEE